MPRVRLTPKYRLQLEGDDLLEDSALSLAFEEGSGAGLLFLDGAHDGFTEDPAFAYWKDFARLYLSQFGALENLEARNDVQVDLPKEDLRTFLAIAPPMKGGEYICEESLHSLWSEIGTALKKDVKNSGKDLAAYFLDRHSGVSLLGRVCFHLAENRKSQEKPFAFLATYARQVSTEGKTQHVPLSRALEEYAGGEERSLLLRLISPISKAAQESVLIKEMSDSGEIYQTLAWTPQKAHRFLKDIPVFERSGIAVRVPNWWQPRKPHRPQVTLKLGETSPSHVGLGALVDFSLSVVLGEENLSEAEIAELLKSTENLVFFKGKWTEIDKEKLGDLLSKWKTASRSLGDGLSFGEAMRLLSGVDQKLGGASLAEGESPVRVISGRWLTKMLDEIRSPEAELKVQKILKENLLATLRPYQERGVAWLYRLNQMQLGGVLADDMGLGKTIQVLALLLLRKNLSTGKSKSLLVVPASLLGNWKEEIRKFAPSLQYWISHPSGDGYASPSLGSVDLVMTTYGSLSKLSWLLDIPWGLIIGDEAQAIKNPSAKQTQALKALKGDHRLALTGTPVENYLGDLWSLFDFVSPGLLGSSKAFESFLKKSAQSGENVYGPLKRLVTPYILRRLKTDKLVIQDLPEKTEVKSYCSLSSAQAVLYQKSVESLAHDIAQVDGIKRRGVVLSYLMRLKQICNHPSQFVKDGRFLEPDSGKFLRLREICEVIHEKQEKVLIFTQFQEMTEPLHSFLGSIFGHQGLVLHGETPIKKRSEMVKQFQSEDGPSYFILSLKAGGTGLTLTAASHVIHFDRWWNPAVENQATDRAFRIGQKRNVLVHKFICRGTLEEKIDSLIESKKALSQDLLEDRGGALLTELGNEELLKIVSLDINCASED